MSSKKRDEHKTFTGLLLGSVAIMIVLFGMYSFVSDSSTTGAAITLPLNKGCCLETCTITGVSECSAPDFIAGVDCKDDPVAAGQCNVGCCIDLEGYCYTNYVQNKCDEEGGNFLQGRECNQYTQCLLPPPRPAQQEGYQYDGLGNVVDIFPEDISVQSGEGIILYSVLFSSAADVKIEVRNDELGYIERFQANDLGHHPDKYDDDLRYTVGWNSGDVSAPINNFTTFTLQTYINGVRNGAPGELIVTPGDCKPKLLHEYSEKKVLFTERGTRGLDFDFELDKFTALYSPRFALAKNMSYYVIEDDINIGASNANSVCPFDFESDDLILQLDFDYPTCTQNGNIVHINPDYVRTRVPMSTDFVTNFCSYVETRRDLIQRYRDSLIEPNVTMIFPSDIGSTAIFTGDTVDISFTTVDNPGDLRYTIYQDEHFKKLSWGYTVAGNNVLTTIPVEDGEHTIFIEIEDLDRNYGEIYFNYTANEDNFFVEMVRRSGANMEIEIDHDNETLFEYFVYDEQMPIARGVYGNGTDNLVNVTLKGGNHSIWARAEDRHGRRASSFSLEYDIEEGRTRETSFITGAVVAVDSSSVDPAVDLTVIRQDDGSPAVIGEMLDDGGIVGRDGFIYYPAVEDSILVDPVKLCGLDVSELDTGMRFYPAQCLETDTVTSIAIEARLKTYENYTFSYDYSFDVIACSEEFIQGETRGVFVDVYLYNSVTGHTEEVSSEIVELGRHLDAESGKDSVGDYDQICITVSDDLVSNLPRCQTFGLPDCRDDIDNDGDGVCDVDGCFNETSYLPPDPGCSDANDFDEGDKTTQCQDGLDNDGDGDIDEDDAGCIDAYSKYMPQLNNESIEGLKACQDGLDNDDDFVVDMDDPGCSTPYDDYEGDETTQCQDGNDNEPDGFIDMADPGCFGPTDNDETHESHDCSLFSDLRFDVQISSNYVSTFESRYAYTYKATICNPGHGDYGVYNIYMKPSSGPIVPVEVGGLIGFNETFEGSGELNSEPKTYSLCLQTTSLTVCKS